MEIKEKLRGVKRWLIGDYVSDDNVGNPYEDKDIRGSEPFV